MVLPFHSLIDNGDRSAALMSLDEGMAQFIVATVSANVGIDMTVTNVVCIDLPDSFEELTQWAGRVRHDGSGGKLIVYGTMDLKVVWPWEHDLQTYIPNKGEKLMAAKTKCCNELQKKTPKVVV